MEPIVLLMRPRFSGLKNRLIRFRGRERRKILIMGAVGLAFCAGVFLLSCRVLRYFQSVEMLGDILARQVLSMVMLTFFSMLVFSSIITALSNLYLSKDLELCHSTPVPVEEIFISRALFTFVDSSWMLLVFALPVLLAYGYVYKPGPLFYLSLVHLNVAMALIAAFAGILITMVMVHVFPAQRIRDVIILLSVFMIAGLYLLFRFMRPERLVNPDAFLSVAMYLNALKGPDSPFLPTHWITETLWSCLKGAGPGDRAFEIVLTWSTAASAVVINVWTAHFIYFDGFSKAREARKGRSGGKRLLDLLVWGVTKPFARDMAAVMAKDIRVFFRDNTQWSQLLLLAALVVVYLYNFSVLPLNKSPIRLDFLQNELAFLNLGLAGFVLSALCARFVFTAVSAEGEAYWIIGSSPMGLSRYLWGKYIFFLLPVLILAEVLIVATNLLLGVTTFMMVLSSITIALICLGIVAMGIGLGAAHPRFRHENIGQVATGAGGFLYMVMSLLFIGLTVILEAGPVYMIFMSRVKKTPIGPPGWIFILVSFAAVVVITAVAVFRPMKKGIRALGDYE